MRRRRSSSLARRVVAASLGVLLGGLPRATPAQGALAEEGALFLLVPVGARAVGMGQAVTAAEDGSEAVWWNPAGLARLEKREAAIHHQRGLAHTADAISIVIPSSLLGVIGLSAHLFNFGTIPGTDIEGTEGGSILTRAFVYAASYATPIGTRVNAGVNYKIAQFRVECTGPCPPNAFQVATSTALDFGLQYDADWLVPVSIGASVRNVGPRFQVNDRAQSDGLPMRLQIGALYRVGQVQRYSKDAELHVTGDLLGEFQFRQPSTHLGADLIWRKRLHARTGWVFDSSELDGPSIGVGLTAGSLVLDIGQLLHGITADGQTPPTYLSLRYLF